MSSAWRCGPLRLVGEPRGLLLAPHVPLAREEDGAAALELEHGRRDRLEEPAIVGDEDRPRRRSSASSCSSHSIEAMSRWLVGSSRSSRSGPPASARASEARVSSPPEKVSRPRSRSRVGEAEAAQHGSGVVAPAVAARVLEPRLRLAVAPERLRAVIAGGHRLLEAAQLALGLDQVGRARERVLAQREAAEPAAAAGRAARRGRPSPRRARRLRARSRPSGRAAASSCRRRSGRRARAGRGARA